MSQEPQEVSVIVPTEQSVTVVMPTKQSVTACMPTEQTVNVVVAAEQSVDVVIPVEQSVSVIAQYSETPEEEGDIEFSNYEVTKVFIFVVIDWDTVPDTKGRIRWRVRDSGDPWTWSNLGFNFIPTHSHMVGMPCTPGAMYEFQAYGIDETDYEEFDVLKYIKISEAGEPEIDV